MSDIQISKPVEVSCIEKKSLIEEYENHKKKMREYQRERIKNNPEYYSSQKKYVTEYLRNKYQNDEEYRKKISDKRKIAYNLKKEARIAEMKLLEESLASVEVNDK